MFTSISGLYAMAIVVLGCVIPVSQIFSSEAFNFSFLFDVRLCSYDLFITRVCDGVWKHSFDRCLVLLHSSLITKINSIYKSTLRYRLQWKHVENELINCLFYLREKLDNLITYFSMFPNLLGGGWVSVLKEVYELYKWMNLCTGNGTILQVFS